MKKQLPTKKVLSCAEIEIHYKRPLFSKMKSITCADDVNSLLRAYIEPKVMDVKELFMVVLLSRANSVLGISTIAMGTIDGVNVNVREIVQLALLSHSSQIIVAHNHPSGKRNPSENDRSITEKIKSALALIDVKLLDHLILTSENYFSFANEGEM